MSEDGNCRSSIISILLENFPSLQHLSKRLNSYQTLPPACKHFILNPKLLLKSFSHLIKGLCNKKKQLLANYSTAKQFFPFLKSLACDTTTRLLRT